MNYTSKAPIEVISPTDECNYFFAYYDLQPFDKDSKRHLAHRVSFNDRIPTGDDICEVGYITLEDKLFHKVGQLLEKYGFFLPFFQPSQMYMATRTALFGTL